MSQVAMTHHRRNILSILLRGDIVDPDGMCTTTLMDATGHRTSNALSGILLELEKAGLVDRDKGGRRTYRIALTSEGRRVAQLLLSKTPQAAIMTVTATEDECHNCAALQAKIERLERVISNLSEALNSRAAS